MLDPLRIAITRSDWTRRRLQPEGPLGLHLTMGALAVFLAAAVFAGLARQVVSLGPIVLADGQLAEWLAHHRVDWLTDIMFFLTFTAGPIAMPVIFGGIALYFVSRRDKYGVLVTVLVLPTGAMVYTLLKVLFARPRPVLEDGLVHLVGYSFPSGHATQAMLLYGLLGYLAVRGFPSLAARVAALLICTLMIAAIAFTRMYLGVHYLSDVLGGVALGAAWLVASLTSVGMLQSRRRRPILSVTT